MNPSKTTRTATYLLIAALSLKVINFLYMFAKTIIFRTEPISQFLASEQTNLSTIFLFTCVLFMFNNRKSADA